MRASRILALLLHFPVIAIYWSAVSTKVQTDPEGASSHYTYWSLIFTVAYYTLMLIAFHMPVIETYLFALLWPAVFVSNWLVMSVGTAIIATRAEWLCETTVEPGIAFAVERLVHVAGLVWCLVELLLRYDDRRWQIKYVFGRNRWLIVIPVLLSVALPVSYVISVDYIAAYEIVWLPSLGIALLGIAGFGICFALPILLWFSAGQTPRSTKP